MLELVRPAKIDALCAGLVFVVAIVVASESRTARSAQAGSESAPAPASNLREGALIELAGHFVQTGERLVFVTTTGERFTSLENLNLQRIADKLQLEAGSLSWSVSGRVSEFRGARYLLISRAQSRRVSASEARRSLLPNPSLR